MMDEGARPVDRAGSERRATVLIGVLLIVLGGAFLLARQAGIDVAAVGWPLFVIVPGIVIFALAFAVGGRAGSGFAIGGAITTVTGLVLAFQNATGLWATWAYAWALVAPGGAGLGLFLYGLFTRQPDVSTVPSPSRLSGGGRGARRPPPMVHHGPGIR